ncbi:MAG: UvrD-helicase domain-containing protein [Flavobacteriales bacterium]
MKSGKNFFVLKSSAGSGKTYALVKYYLILALQTDNPAYYKHILAITFTNAAAKEMKERVIGRLKDFSNELQIPDSQKPLFDELCAELKVQPHQLALRAKNCLVHMLHNYSMIGVSTIDSFTHKIVRSFARDLRLHPDFNIEMDSAAFAQKIVDQCLDTVGTDEELTAYLKQFTLENFEDEKGLKVRPALEEVSKQLFNEDAQDVLPILENYALADFQNIREGLKKQIRNFDESLVSVGMEALKLISSQGIEASDFAYKGAGTYSVFKKISEGNFELPGKRFTDESNSRWYTKTAKGPALEAIQSIEDQLDAFRIKVIGIFESSEYREYLLRKEVIKVIYSMGMLSRLAKIGKAIKEEENTLLISDFQTIINEIVSDSPAPFIYERVGERYNHILFDEFQDTSGMQWNNFLPLIENALSKGQFNLIVGDGKQAIYRWRNGKAEQFVSLPELLGNHIPERRQALKYAYEKGVLTHNYRSYRTIIRFNNELFDFLKQSDAYNSITEVYEDHHQEMVKGKEGYVEVESVPKSDKVSSNSDDDDAVDADIIGLVVEKVKDALADGYLPGDIAILTRRAGKEAGPIAKALHENDIGVVTKESFLLNNSAKVRLIMAFMKYIFQSDHLYSKVSIWQNLCILHPDKFDLKKLVEEYSEVQHHTVVPNIHQFLEKYYPEALQIQQIRSSIEMAEAIIQCFQLEKDAFVEFLLDNLTRLSTQRDYSILETLEWWEERQGSLYTSTQESDDKVNIMTIHKSKGLQFPVVIYPRIHAGGNERKFWASVDEDVAGVPKALLSTKAAKYSPDKPIELEHEIHQHNLDQVNLLYVATTRAEERLYVILDSKKDEVSKSIEAFAQASMTTDSTKYFIGEKTKVVSQKSTQQNGITISGKVQPNIHSVQLRYTYLKDNIEADQEQRINGNIIHECLSHIAVPADIASAIEKVKPKFPAIQDIKWREVAEQLLQIVDHPGVRQWFNKEVKLLNEQEIILPSGHPIRPDRIIKGDDFWQVIDFKTGQPSKSHLKQVKNYMEQVHFISGKPVKGYLLYTGNMNIQEVF